MLKNDVVVQAIILITKEERRKKMKNKVKHDFIASSKVIRHKLDPKAADVLAVLLYKYQYWSQEGKLINDNVRSGFHISVDDIREETCFGKSAIQSSIKLLKENGLIDYKRQGLTKPNIYFIDEVKINKYIKDHEAEYKKWRLNIRDKKVVVLPMDRLKDENQPSRRDKTGVQEVEESATTKNKNTNNKKIKTLTNPINGEKEKDLIQYSVMLEELIDELRSTSNLHEKNKAINDIYNFLINIIPEFRQYKISKKDTELIAQMSIIGPSGSSVAERIFRNIRAILNGKKESRFGNLFVGIGEMNKEYELKYG